MLHLMVTMTMEYITSDDTKYFAEWVSPGAGDDERVTYNLQQPRAVHKDNMLPESGIRAQRQDHTVGYVKALFPGMSCQHQSVLLTARGQLTKAKIIR